VPCPANTPPRVCPIARSLEIVGERWTLLVVRDAFYGVVDSATFALTSGFPRPFSPNGFSLLIDEGVLVKAAGGRGRDEYVLTRRAVGSGQ